MEFVGMATEKTVFPIFALLREQEIHRNKTVKAFFKGWALNSECTVMMVVL